MTTEIETRRNNMVLPKGAETIEVVTLLATLADLFLDNRRGRGTPHMGAVASPAAGTTKGFADLIERVIGELGFGVRDEGLFPLKLAKLSNEDRAVIEELLARHEKRLVNRLRIIAINVPNPPPTKVKGKKERKENGKVVEAAEPDKEIPSDIDNGKEFLAYIANAIRGKSMPEQIKVLENLNVAPGKSGLFALEASKNIAKKAGKALGFPEDANTEQVLARLRELVSQIEIPDPTKSRPNDKAGWFVRFMRMVTPGSFPNQ
jgi:hypothetical protein